MIPIAKPVLGKEEAKAASDVVLSGWVTQGPKIKEFEEAFAKFVGAPYACAISNCTTALHAALLALDIKCGDAVITVSHSFIATANAIRYCGAEPLFVDIDPNTFNMDPLVLAEFLAKECKLKNGKLYHKNQKVAAILVVHQIGMPCDLASILGIAKKYKLPVVEDAACAIGSEISFDEGKSWEKIGKPHGDLACFSFHPRKVMTTGEGGMITTKSAALDKRLRLIRHHGMSVSDLARHQSKKIIQESYDEVGYNYRLTDIQAAIGIEQLKKLPEIIKRRRVIAKIYQRELSKINWLEVLIEPNYARSNWQSFAVRIKRNAPKKRDALMQHLLDSGVASRPGIMNSHEEKPYRVKGFTLKNSESARKNVILLPLYVQMTETDINKIITSLKNA